ncbi:MAG: DNA repair protein RadC [Nitrospirota bacterium]
MKIRSIDFQGYPKQLKQKYCKFGVDYLMDSELLELLLLYSKPRRDIRELSDNLLAEYRNFKQVLDEPINKLVAFPDMDMDSAIILKLAKDCSNYYLGQKDDRGYSIRCGMDVIKYCQASMAGLPDEQFKVVFLNVKSEISGIEILQEDMLDELLVYPEKVIDRARHYRASALILVHNHPSGSVKPSTEDMEMTDNLIQAASDAGIEVYDHIIIGRNNFFSFRESGLIKDGPAVMSAIV